MPRPSDNGASRRGFIKHSVVATAAVITTGGLTTALAQSAVTSRKWSKEADVLVVGSGAAAMAAAVAVIQAGNSVILLEKASTAGGTTIKSDGGYWIPNNSWMKAKGLADPKVDAIRYMALSSYPLTYRADQPSFGLQENEYALIEAFYDNAAPAIDSLEAAGAVQSMIVDIIDYFDHAPVNKAPRGRVLVPKAPGGGMGNGRELIRQLRAWLTAKQVPILFKHAVGDIEKNKDGEVIGLQAIGPDGPVFFRAKKAVIFGSGGYTHNPEMMLNFQPGPIFGGCAVPTNQGDLVNMGIRAGTKLGNMVNAWRAQLVLEEALQIRSVSRDIWQPPGDSMILVNKYGSRVVDEKRNYSERTRVHAVWDAVESEYPNKLLFMIYDLRTAELFAGNFPIPDTGVDYPYVISAATLPELTVAIQKRLDSHSNQIGPNPLSPDFAKTLTAEIKRFSEDAKTGKDTRFHRGKYPYDAEWQTINSIPKPGTKWPKNTSPNPTIYPFESKGPYFAVILGAGTLDTNGGPVVNAKAQMLDTRGNPIPGLYGAGNCIASPAASAYWGAGGTIGPAMTFGTIAGRHAAAEAVKKES